MSESQSSSALTVFISYSQDSKEHCARVLQLSKQLRDDGIETILDRYVSGTPDEGWQRWMQNCVDRADRVLVICTEPYYRRFRGIEKPGVGKGADWEAHLITQELYNEKSATNRFIPVLFAHSDTKHIPEALLGQTYYVMDSAANYQSLYDDLLGQAGIDPGPLGPLKRKVRPTATPMTFESAPAGASATRSSPRIDISRIIKYAPEQLIGRETETALLEDSWAQAVAGEPGRPHVLGFVALGGEGKTSLVTKWLGGMPGRGWPGCESVFAWSFYSQGSREQAAVSSDLFLAEALKFFGDPDTADSALGAYEKGQRLAALVGGQRSLLILDGVEPLQYPPSSPTGSQLKDQGVEALLKSLAANSQGLCIVTTRYTIPDLSAFAETTWREEALERLSREAGVALLKILGVRGSELRPDPTPSNPDPLNEYEQLVEDVKGHALTLHLLGSYLRDAHGGDIRRRDRIRLDEADAEEQGGHAFRVLDAYVDSFENGAPEDKPQDRESAQRALAILQLLGLFDRPATADCLEALWAGDAIPGLTEPLVGMTGEQRNITLSRLEKARLVTVNRDESTSRLLSLDSHPLIREYFARRLRGPDPEETSEVWRAAHKRLYEHLRGTTEEGDEPTLEDLQPLYQAVAHGCHAGLYQETLDNVYKRRIYRGAKNYAANRLGAFGSELGAMACFFVSPWDRVSPVLEEPAQTWVLAISAFGLRALGRLTEALGPLREGLPAEMKRYDWLNSAITASNLSQLELTLGDVSSALSNAKLCVTYADRSGDAFQKYSKRTTLAKVLHEQGLRPEAEALFCQAEKMQAELQPQYPFLYSVMGFEYCDLMLVPAEVRAWRRTMDLRSHPVAEQGANPDSQRETTPPFNNTYLSHSQVCRDVSDRATQTLAWVTPEGWLLDIALDHLTLSRTALYESLLKFFPIPHLTPALSALSAGIDAAVSGLRRAGESNYLPRGLLTRAWLRSLLGQKTGRDSAKGDLDEAWEIASRSSMGLFMADIHLHRARLFGPIASPHREPTEETPYPWQSVEHDLGEARRLIEKHGYGRRVEELEDAEAALLPEA